MKVNKRSVPMDQLSVEEKGLSVHVCTHGQREIIISIRMNGKSIMEEWMTLEEFVNLLMKGSK